MTATLLRSILVVLACALAPAPALALFQDAPVALHELHVPVATAGSSYSAAFSIENLPAGASATWTTSGPLPSGIVFTGFPTSAILTGTTSDVGAFPFVVTVVVSPLGTTATRGYVLFVNAAGTTPAEFDQSGLPGGRVGTVYAHELSVAPQPFVYFGISVFAGALPAGTSWHHEHFASYGAILGTPTTPTAGPQRFVMKVDASGVIQLRELSIDVVAASGPPPLTITTLALFPAQIGQPYAQALTAEGGPSSSYTWTAKGLPAGLFLSAGDPTVIAGTPATGQTTGPRFVIVNVASGGQTLTKRYRMFLNPAGALPSLSADLDPAEEEVGYNGSVAATGAFPFTLRVESGIVPPGIYTGSFFSTLLFVDAPSAGTAAYSPYRFVVSAVDNQGIAVFRECSIRVVPLGHPAIRESSPFAIHVDEGSSAASPYNRFHLSALDSDAAPSSLAWSISSPPQHGAASIVSGSPSSPGHAITFAYEPDPVYSGTDAFAVQVADAEGHTDTITVGALVQGVANTWHWGRLNGGRPIGERYHDQQFTGFVPRCFDVLSSGEGAFGGSETGIVYSGRSKNAGRYLGRLREDGVWEMSTPSGWSSDPALVPLAIDKGGSRYGMLDLVPHPDYAGGWLGVARASFGFGPIDFDIHGHPAHVVFDGSTWKTWTGGTSYDELRYHQIFGWQFSNIHVGRRAFAFDAAHRRGIFVGCVGGVSEGHTSASRLDLDDTVSAWRRWSHPVGQAGAWSAGPDVYYRDSLVLDPRVDWEHLRVEESSIVHLAGTRRFLMTFRMSSPDGRLCAARYDDAVEAWSWWDGTSWQPADQEGPYWTQIAGVVPGSNIDATAFETARLPDGGAVILASAQGIVYAVTCDATTGLLSAPVAVTPCDGGSTWMPAFAHGVAADGTVVLVYKDGLAIRMRQRAPSTGAWSAPQLVYATLADFALLDVAWSDGRMVVFYREATSTGECDNYALGDTPAVNWTHETPLVLSPLVVAGSLDPSWSFVKSVPNGAPGTGASVGIALCADADGYVWGSHAPGNHVVVHAPDSNGIADNQSWGAYWDHFLFPGPIAVWPEHDKVFVATSLSTGGAGGPWPEGYVSVWEMTETRDHSYGYWSPPPGYIADYYPQILFGPTGPFVTPGGLCVDRSRGVLYVASSYENTIHVIDVLDTVDSSEPWARSTYDYGILPANQPHVQAVLDELVVLGDMFAAGPAFVAWVSTSWASVRAHVVASASFAQISGDGDDTDFLRVLQNTFKQRRDLPVPLFSYAATGAGPGEMRMPMSLACDDKGRLVVLDSGNDRVQVLDPDLVGHTMSFVREFGSRGRGHGQLLRPVSLSVSPQNEVYVADPLNARITVYTTLGQLLYDFDAYGTAQGSVPLSEPLAIWAGRADSLYVGYSSGAGVATFQR